MMVRILFAAFALTLVAFGAQAQQGYQPPLMEAPTTYSDCGNGPLNSCLPTVQAPVVVPQPQVQVQPAVRAAEPRAIRPTPQRNTR